LHGRKGGLVRDSIAWRRNQWPLCVGIALRFALHFLTCASFVPQAYTFHPRNSWIEHDPMHWLQLTQAQTGATIYVNMSLVILVAPNKTGGAALVTSVREKESARIVPVLESPQEIMDMLNGSSSGAQS